MQVLRYYISHCGARQVIRKDTAEKVLSVLGAPRLVEVRYRDEVDLINACMETRQFHRSPGWWETRGDSDRTPRRPAPDIHTDSAGLRTLTYFVADLIECTASMKSYVSSPARGVTLDDLAFQLEDCDQCRQDDGSYIGTADLWYGRPRRVQVQYHDVLELIDACLCRRDAHWEALVHGGKAVRAVDERWGRAQAELV